MHNPIEPKTWDQGAKWAIARKDHLNPAQTRCLGWTFSYKQQTFKEDNNMTSIENFYILGLIFVYHKSIAHTYQTFMQFNISALASVHPFVCMYINPYISHTLVYHHLTYTTQGRMNVYGHS